MQKKAPENLHVLVHIHLYYHEMWDELAICIKNLQELGINYDLYVSLVESNENIEELIKQVSPNCKILKVANRGYDLGPFIGVLNDVDLKKYDLVIKLHSKRDVPHRTTIGSIYDVSHSKWREFLLSFVKDKCNLTKVLKAFCKDQNLGMVASYKLIIPFLHHGSYNLWFYNKAYELFSKCKLKANPQKNFIFVAGTMFALKAELAQKIKELGLTITDFDVPNRRNEKDLAHTLEYFFGWMTTSSQNTSTGKYYKIKDVYTNRFIQTLDIMHLITKKHIFVKIFRFLYRREYTQSTQIEVFKILKFTVFKRNIK